MGVPVRPPHPRIAVEDLRATRNIVASLYEFSGGSPRDRRTLLEMAGLSRFLHGIDLNGAPGSVAGALVTKLSEFGKLPDRPEYDALGALFVYLLSAVQDLPVNQQKFLAEMIVKHELVEDSKYVQDLHATYSLDEVLLSGATAAATMHAEPPFRTVVDEADAHSLEQVIASEDNFLDVNSLAGALYSAHAVCLVEIPKGSPQGTGFLINRDLLMTNQHVLRTEEDVREAVVRFDYRMDENGVASSGAVFSLDDGFYHSSPAEQLDFALVKTRGIPLQHLIATDVSVTTNELTRLGKHRGYLVVAPRFLRRSERVNIIQHPAGQPLKVVLTQNRIANDMTDSRVQYVADTQHGSSGSPVFDQHWNVVALHHSGQPYPAQGIVGNAKRAWRGVFRVNEGVPIRAILKNLDERGLTRYLP
jgi:V8-like Glu-specific endopeptidase